MKRLILLAAVALSGCATDQRIADIQSSHRKWVCANQTAVTAARDLVPFIRDAGLRAVAQAQSDSDMAIIATCPKAETTA